MLRDALATMLEEQPEDGYLIVQLLIEEREPALVARELGTSQGGLLDEVRDALDDSGIFYEDAAFGALGQGAKEQARATRRR
jgi:hypothetical protein